MSPFDLDGWLASAPALPPIVQAGAAVLRQRAQEVPVALVRSRAFERLVEKMVDAMRAAPGVGLAAPQIGVPLRVFVAEDDAAKMAKSSPEALALRRRVALPLTILVNPTVTLSPIGEATFYEGCLSVRGYGALVRRASAVSVTGADLAARPVSLKLEGWPARIMQHEMDHLNGTLYVDRMISRSLANEEEMRRLAGLSAEEALRELGDPAV